MKGNTALPVQLQWNYDCRYSNVEMG